MRRFILYLIIAILVLPLLSCSKGEIVSPIKTCKEIECDSTQLLGKLDTIWTKKVSEFGGLSDQIFFSNDYLYWGWLFSNEGTVTKLSTVEKGEIVWNWKDNEIRQFPSAYLLDSRGKLLLQDGRKIFGIDLNSGSTILNYIQSEGSVSNPFGQVLGEYYYYSQLVENRSRLNLVRSHLDDLSSWEVVYTFDRTGLSSSAMLNAQSYNLWVEESSGDSILIFQQRMALPNRVDLVAYNFTKGEIKWKKDNVSKRGNSNHQQILVNKNKAYFGCGDQYLCFDLNTGDKVWSFDHPGGIEPFLYLKSVIAEDINSIVVKSNSPYLFCLDLDTGEPKWITEETTNFTAGAGSPVYHNGIIYMTNRGLLFALRGSTGELLWKERTTDIPLAPTDFQGDIAIDKENNIIYATSSDKVFAIRAYQE